MQGDEYVVSSYGTNWCIINTRTNRRKIIGPFRMKGTNYFDKAKEEAARRMNVSIDKVRYVP